MPSKGDPLSAAEIVLLKSWINAGAEWPETGAPVVKGQLARSEMIVTDEDRQHWSYLPLKRSDAPLSRGKSAALTPVDAFIIARLNEKKLTLSPQVDARKLARRIYFDLIGLPPTPEQVDSFVQQFVKHAAGAVESLVDQLLASPHYGERWARHWLDVVHYADTHGNDQDRIRTAVYLTITSPEGVVQK